MPDSLLELGSYVFSGCSSLCSITMPSQAIAIESTAFYGTGYYNDPSSWDSGVLYVDSYLVATNAEFAAVSSFSVKPGTIAIAEKAFANNGKKFESITLPDGLLFIGDGAFSSLSSLKIANIPSSVNRIGYGVFSGASLSQITIPSSVLAMGELVFNQNRVDLSINCLAESKPEGWDDDWAYSYKEGVSISVNWAA